VPTARFNCLVLVSSLGFGCGDTSEAPELGATTDLGVGFDLAAPATCSPNDPQDDGQTCSGACPTGLVPVVLLGQCRCYHVCDPARPTTCSCNRRCAALADADGGVKGGACLPGNGPGERCGSSPTGQPYGHGGCAQGTACVNEDTAGQYRYCVYECQLPGDCPTYSTCLAETDPGTGTVIGHACALDSSENGTKAVGQACTAAEACRAGFLCDSICRPQCDGPGASCASGTCTSLVDGARVVGYVCR
jgi:hypothetical protein